MQNDTKRLHGLIVQKRYPLPHKIPYEWIRITKLGRSWLKRGCLIVFFLALLDFSLPVPAVANDLRLTFISQSPQNTVPLGQPITYTIETKNVDDGITDPSSIGVGIRIEVNGIVKSASSGEFTSNDCRVDPDFPAWFACNNLSEGGSQRPTFTWNNPEPGTSEVTFRGICQLVPEQDPRKYCSLSDRNTDSVTTIVGIVGLDCESAVALTSGVPYSGSTSSVPPTPSQVNSYSCLPTPETGPERFHKITTTATGILTASLSKLETGLEVFILNKCDPQSCLAMGDSEHPAVYSDAPPGTYYIVVDGPFGAAGNYTLNVNFTPTDINSCRVIDTPGTYTLTGSIINSSDTNCIEITSSYVTLDGNGRQIDGVDTEGTHGIHVYHKYLTLTYVTIRNLKVTDWDVGIYFQNINVSTIEASTVESNQSSGVHLYGSDNNTITNSTINTNNIFGIFLNAGSNNNTISENTVNGQGQGIQVGKDASTADSNIIRDNNIGGNKTGIDVENSDSLTIEDNTFTYNWYGIFLYGTTDSTITRNVITDSGYKNQYAGIFLYFSQKNLIFDNLFDNYQNVDFSQYPELYGNTWNIERQLGTNIVGGPYLDGNYRGVPDGSG
ncbi:MAG: right-handed parallel beta-helix repeat-containing protein, partial [Syntrophobacterales bacterium]